MNINKVLTQLTDWVTRTSKLAEDIGRAGKVSTDWGKAWNDNDETTTDLTKWLIKEDYE